MEDERPETKREKFDRLRDMRVPKITHAIGLLENLSAASYESSQGTRQAVVDELQAAVDSVAAAFDIIQVKSVEPAPAPAAPPEKPKQRVVGEDVKASDLADGGATVESEIRWAYDAVQRKDWKLAANRIKRIIDMWGK
jgi:hypothetical protein